MRYTPQKINIDTKHGHIEKGIHFPNHNFGIHVSFRGCKNHAKSRTFNMVLFVFSTFEKQLHQMMTSSPPKIFGYMSNITCASFSVLCATSSSDLVSSKTLAHPTWRLSLSMFTAPENNMLFQTLIQ